MPAPKGNKFSPGRPKGKQNRDTITANEATLYAFDDIGGRKAYAKWCKDNPDLFYTKIYSKLIKQGVEVTGADGGPIKTTIEVEFVGPGTKN